MDEELNEMGQITYHLMRQSHLCRHRQYETRLPLEDFVCTGHWTERFV